MNNPRQVELHTRIEQLLRPGFVTELLRLRDDEGAIAGYVTSLYLDEAEIEVIHPVLNPPTKAAANEGQVGCFHTIPVFRKTMLRNRVCVSSFYEIDFHYSVYRESISVSQFRGDLMGWKADESKKRDGFLALDAYEALAGRPNLTKHDLIPIVTAASSRYGIVWDIGTRFLVRIAAKHEPAREILTNLMTTNRAPMRIRVLARLTDCLPKSFCISLARQGLKDRSKRVRQTALETCRCLILTEMIEDLRQAGKKEPDPETKRRFEIDVPLIRDGYHVFKNDDGSRNFVVRISDGYPAELTYPGPAGEALLTRMEPRLAAEEVRRQSNHSWRPFRWPNE